ncbi:phospholipase B1, membrane-associated-like [Macrosteles quadrilineatus]|uniref:phospholipase B1, membrane-associated-like n=1 Tax=Macrosteles quadrilineatus TaxID=74068 RepID=UPI0023E1D5D9|nr:phospholipase B1, membrane-associated-like [Macrosteles quadrilineatus]
MRLWPYAMLSLLTFCCCDANNWRFELSLKKFEQIRDVLLNAVGRTSNNPGLLKRAGKLNKLQPAVSEERPFPCQTEGFRSPERPDSVHRLRPGDIDVVGALGDSLTAGNGAAASTLLHVYTENRGISWSIGGQGTWREFLTLPNLLKEFNPSLVGYSLKDSLTHHRASQFNVGEAGAMSDDLPYMAGQLIKRIRSDPRVNIYKDWKLITLMMGSNDFCLDICYIDTKIAPERHRKNLIKTLDLLKEALPRTLVQIVISPNLGKIITKFKGVRPLCQLTHNFECPCLFGLAYQHRQREFLQLMDLWQLAEFKVASDLRYQNSDDFAVVAQPFTFNISFPIRRDRLGNILTDFTYLSEDCFHFSQKGYSRAVTALWNNMLEPIGQKRTNWGMELEHFLCPTEDRPYISTFANS